jgi:hypothetical protein
MCFSASASFVASTILIPVGIYCLREARKIDRAYLPISGLPLLFGIQQGCEGFVWLGITSENTTVRTFAALCFLFFSHCVWLFWLPFSAFCVEKERLLKNVLRLFAIAGAIYGSLLYFPLLINHSWLQIEVINHSIAYKTYFFFNGMAAPLNFSFYTYASIILLPLAISSRRNLNFLGGLVTMAALITYLIFHYAFISVWCFMAAIVSIYLIYAIDNIASIDSLTE